MNKEHKYHIHLTKQQIGGAEYAILPGDPDRVEKIALSINENNSHFLAQNREYTSWITQLGGKKIIVCSTGIGGPSTSIAVEELAALGIKYFYRVGTCGAIQPETPLPCLMITTGAVRLDGASQHYAPIEYPAVADWALTTSLITAAEELRLPYRTGITVSSDTFYPGQERYETFTGYIRRHFQGSLFEWQKLNALNYEMEAATLLVMASAFGLQAATVTAAVASRALSEKPDESVVEDAEGMLCRVVKRALEVRLKGSANGGRKRSKE